MRTPGAPSPRARAARSRRAEPHCHRPQPRRDIAGARIAKGARRTRDGSRAVRGLHRAARIHVGGGVRCSSGNAPADGEGRLSVCDDGIGPQFAPTRRPFRIRPASGLRDACRGYVAALIGLQAPEHAGRVMTSRPPWWAFSFAAPCAGEPAGRHLPTKNAKPHLHPGRAPPTSLSLQIAIVWARGRASGAPQTRRQKTKNRWLSDPLVHRAGAGAPSGATNRTRAW